MSRSAERARAVRGSVKQCTSVCQWDQEHHMLSTCHRASRGKFATMLQLLRAIPTMPQQMRNGLIKAAVDLGIYMLLRNGFQNTNLAQRQLPSIMLIGIFVMQQQPPKQALHSRQASNTPDIPICIDPESGPAFRSYLPVESISCRSLTVVMAVTAIGCTPLRITLILSVAFLMPSRR